VTQGSPPNIISILARVAQQQVEDSSATPVLASPSLLSPEQRERSRLNREAALRRRTASSPGPSQTWSAAALGLSPATSSSVTNASTPPTIQRTSVTRSLPSLDSPLASPQQQRIELAAQKLFRAIGTSLPTVPMPDDRCFKCASAIHTGACTNKTVSQLLYDANCCASCALPL
jgi:hypothetical protein